MSVLNDDRSRQAAVRTVIDRSDEIASIVRLFREHESVSGRRFQAAYARDVSDEGEMIAVRILIRSDKDIAVVDTAGRAARIGSGDRQPDICAVFPKVGPALGRLCAQVLHGDGDPAVIVNAACAAFRLAVLKSQVDHLAMIVEERMGSDFTVPLSRTRVADDLPMVVDRHGHA